MTPPPSASPRGRNPLAKFYRTVAKCRDCPNVCPPPVIGPRCGPPDAQLMFIGEAPGRQGAYVSGRAFVGDASGRNFARLLEAVGLNIDDVYITNAVLCCPQVDGQNRKPTAAERDACAEHLRKHIEMVKPELILTLGREALVATARAFDHRPPPLVEAAGTLCRIGACNLAPLYHPSPRVMAAARTFDRQLSDLRAALDAYAEIRREIPGRC